MTRDHLKQLANMDLRTMRIFCKVVEVSGFTHAASELNISRSAVSIAISDLEIRTGLHLCNRGRGGFSLTCEGEQFYLHVQALQTSIATFCNEVNQIHNKTAGEIYLGITDSFINHKKMVITDMISQMRDKFPDVAVHLQMMPSKKVEMDLRNNLINVGIIQVEKKMDAFDYYPLYSEIENLYCGAGHSLFHDTQPHCRLDVIAEYPTIQSSSTINIDWSQFNVCAESPDREGTAFLILSGSYLGFLPDFYAEQWVATGRMKQVGITEIQNEITYEMIVNKSNSKNVILDHWLALYNEMIAPVRCC
ncbi:LysR family transcriptional regulator [Aliivibrio kagoshimensis]|uniref:LysR family transcriptional regulator n=1 Tax=Aliivibrio kagoshimensis TaxID=2910230 RepID=UPI003D0C07B6